MRLVPVELDPIQVGVYTFEWHPDDEIHRPHWCCKELDVSNDGPMIFPLGEGKRLLSWRAILGVGKKREVRGSLEVVIRKIEEELAKRV